jgi:hypothetical protein
MSDLLESRAAIHDLVLRYCRGVDLGDYDRIASVFHPDAVYVVGERRETAQAFAARAAKLERRGMMHFIGNHLVEIAGDRAISEAYFLSFQVVSTEDGDATRTRAGRYCDEVERRDGVWKIATRYLVDTWGRLDPVGRNVPGVELAMGKPAGEDIVDILRAFLGG